MRNNIEFCKPSNAGLIVMGPAGPWRISIGLRVGVFLPILLTSQFASCQQPEGGLSPNGQALFLQRCAKCHGEKGEGISAVINVLGPSLQAEHDRGIVMAAMEVGPGHMPTFVYALSVPEMRAVADYVTQQIGVIPLTGGNLSEGGELFRANCAPCHRTAGRGGALAFTGVNAPALTDKSAAIIAGAIRWGPGPMPAFPASVLNDRQLASVVQYVKFVQHPPNPGGNPTGYFGPVAEGLAGWIAVFLLIGAAMWIERGGTG
jgi:quinol---cytochrome-c reductase cytochrome c subunit